MADPYLSTRVTGMLSECSDYYKLMALDAIKKKRQVTAGDFRTIFEDARDPAERARVRQRSLKGALEEARSEPGNLYDREREKIVLRFPKDFHLQQEDMLRTMQQDYQDVLQTQQQAVAGKLAGLLVDVDQLSHELDGLRCKNVEVIEKLSAGMMAGFALNAPEIVELLLDDLLQDTVHRLNGLERLKHENADLIAAGLQKNRLRQRLAASSMMNVWHIVEALEAYKDDLCE